MIELNSPIVMLSHFHRDFPFNFESSWVKASYASRTDVNDLPSNNGEFINVTLGINNILKYRSYYSNVSELDFLKAIGQQPTDLYLSNLETSANYLSCGSYRRYLWIDASRQEEKITLPATTESCKQVTSDEQMHRALDYLENCDIIINRERVIDTTVENQYLRYELPEYWFLFKEAISIVNPSYKPYISWFTESTRCTYEGVYILRKDIFKRLVKEFFSIMEIVWSNCSEVFPDKSKKSYSCSEPFPWRYPGFLNERFVPFFVHANELKKVEVPLVFLG